MVRHENVGACKIILVSERENIINNNMNKALEWGGGAA